MRYVFSEEDMEALDDSFTKRWRTLRDQFVWSQENRKAIVDISDRFMHEFTLAYEEAIKQREILESRIAARDPFVTDYEIEISLCVDYQNIFREFIKDDFSEWNEDDYRYDEFLSKQSTIEFYLGHNRQKEELPLYIDKELNWNISVFPADWDENMYVSYAVHELVCHNCFSFQDLLKIKMFSSDVKVLIQKYDIEEEEDE